MTALENHTTLIMDSFNKYCVPFSPAYRQRMVDNFEKKLRDQGHTCIISLESYPSQTIWCESNPCKGRQDRSCHR
jgi:hypothetical protein